METVTASVRDNGQQIMITLRLHNDNTCAKIETYFLFLFEKKMKLIHHEEVIIMPTTPDN